MEQMNLDMILQKQKTYFESGITIPVKFRIEMLKKLYRAIQTHEEEINRALTED